MSLLTDGWLARYISPSLSLSIGFNECLLFFGKIIVAAVTGRFRVELNHEAARRRVRFSDLISSSNVFSVGLSGMANRSEMDAGRRENMSSLAHRVQPPSSLLPNSYSLPAPASGVDAPNRAKPMHNCQKISGRVSVLRVIPQSCSVSFLCSFLN